MAQNALFAWTNYAKTATLTGSSAATYLPVSNVATDSGAASAAWQTVYGSLTSVTLTLTPTVTGKSWDVIGLFRTNLTPAASVTFTLYTNPSTSVWTTTLSGPVAGYGQVIALPPASTIADYCIVTLNDSTCPDGFLNIPLVFAGAAWRPLASAGLASTMGRDSTVTELTSRAGQEYPALYYQRKRWNVTLDGMHTAETWASADLMNIYAAGGSNVLFVPDVNSAYYQQEGIFGRLKPTADISYPYAGADRRRWVARITERL